MNNKKYIYLDLFSGVAGFHLGLERAGFKFSKTYFSEIDKNAIAVYKHKFKKAEYVGSVENVSGIERPNIITFGSPCQDFSVAGKQKGLDGERSSLIEYAIRLIARYKPDFFIWENVKGAFSSNNGADFWAIIQAFANIGGYRLEWQLLNTAWVLPQNRERIYLVGHLDGRSKPGVFPFRESDSEFNQKHQHTTESEIASTLQSPGNACENYKGMNAIEVNPKISYAIAATYHKGKYGKGRGTLVAPVIQQKSRGFNKVGKKEICPTISSCAFEQNNVVKYTQQDVSGKGHKSQQDRIYNPEEIMATLGSHRLESKVNIEVKPVLTPDRKEKRQNGRRFKEDGEPAFTLNTQDMHGVMVSGLTMERTTEGKSLRKKYEKGELAHRFNEHRKPVPRKDSCSNTLDTNQKSQTILEGSYIRRLTEIECERLQGFPDNWTEQGNYDGKVKKVSKTQRYKQMGNAVTVDIVEIVAKRIIEKCLK